MVLAQEESFCSKALTIQFHEKKTYRFLTKCLYVFNWKMRKSRTGFSIFVSKELCACHSSHQIRNMKMAKLVKFPKSDKETN